MNKKIYIPIAIVVFILVVSTAAYFLVAKKSKNIEAPTPGKISLSTESSAEEVPVAKENLVRRYLDGVYVSEGAENKYPVAVMIDNHKDARPASGISKAGLVIEAEAEGGVTRYFAVFTTDEKIDEIGPVRSARPYYVDWAEELSAVYAHVGGSPEALTQIINDNVFDMNEFFKGSYFWRDHTRLAPHNVYISTDNLKKYLEKISLTAGKYDQWQFKDDELKENITATSSTIKINYRIKDFVVEWKYDPANNNYIRFLGGKEYKDKAGNIVTAKNVVIQYARANEADEKLRLDMAVVGTGKAIVCQDGKCEKGIWKKKTKKARTKFFQDSEEFSFNAGLTWVNVVRPYYKVEIK